MKQRRNRGKLLVQLGAATVLALFMSAAAQAQQTQREAQREAFLADRQQAWDLPALKNVPCVNGFADIYPCSKVDLLAFMPLNDIGGGEGNDIWGWTDPTTGKEYALMGRTSGTSFVDISDPENPVYLGNLPSHTSNSNWRDIKVHDDFAFIVSEASGHGMQVFDLGELRSVTNPPVTFSETAHYDGFGDAHNLVINEDSAFAYAVGTNTCNGGLHMVDISNTGPPSAGCFSQDGYTHDAQCVDYVGPDPDYQGAEICFNANEDTLTIVDVSNKATPTQISRTGYGGAVYTHQGWLTEDHRFYLLDDELDELFLGHNTRTRIWDVSDLDAPQIIATYDGRTSSIDHNLYTVGDVVYEANYRSGLAVLDGRNVDLGVLAKIGYFDVYPDDDNPDFNGAWSVYPFFESGVVVVSGIEQGLFVLWPNLTPDMTLSPPVPGEAGVVNTWDLSGAVPGAQVVLVGSRSSGHFDVPGCTGLQLDVDNPIVVARAIADGSGNATFSRLIPNRAGGLTFLFQAGDRVACTLSTLEVDTL